MKILNLTLVTLALFAFNGCSEGTPGGSTAKPSGTNTPTSLRTDKPVVGNADETFTLDMPNLSTKVRQGESKEVTIGIARGKNFDDDVSLKFTDLPKGVTMDPATPMIRHGDKDIKVTFHAADDAALGDFKLKVLGHPTKGADATNEFKLTVAERSNS
jgi:uncharacterized membrane protein